jgi:hypothetical protein
MLFVGPAEEAREAQRAVNIEVSCGLLLAPRSRIFPS